MATRKQLPFLTAPRTPWIAKMVATRARCRSSQRKTEEPQLELFPDIKESRRRM